MTTAPPSTATTPAARTPAGSAASRAAISEAAGPAWVSIEGINGVGKTRLAAQAARRLGAICLPLVELPETSPGQLTGQVIAALHRCSGDRFLRTGHPRTEAMLLAALMVHRHEHLHIPPGVLPGVQVVLEDRGPHSVAAYQAAILTEDDDHAHTLARQILASIAAWRPLPDTVLLLRDDPAACLRRFEHRTEAPATADEQRLMDRVDRLYTRMAADDPTRFTVIDRTLTDEPTTIDAIAATCNAAADGRSSCAR